MMKTDECPERVSAVYCAIKEPVEVAHTSGNLVDPSVILFCSVQLRKAIRM